MTFQPIVERELRVTARRSGIYRNRVLMPALLVLFLLLEWVFTPFGFAPAVVGRLVYNVLSYLALAVCLLEGVRQTADCISEEKRDGTLGLLFLTDLNGYDVVMGKLAAASLASIHGLLAMVPILGCALFLGGVTPAEIFRVALALGSILSFSLAAGLWVSSRSRSASHAMGGTLLLLLLFLLVPWPLNFNPCAFLSPAWAFFGASDSNYSSHPLAYWASLLFAQTSVVFLLARAAANTNRFREDEPVKSAASASTTNRDTAPNWKHRAELLDITPVFWLAGRKAGAGIVIWVLVLLAVAAVAGFFVANLGHPAVVQIGDDFKALFGFVLVVHLILKVCLAAQACRCLAEARRNTTLEILLCTPLKVQDILRGQVLSLMRMFLKPFLVLLLLEMIGIYRLLYQYVGVSAPGRSGYHDLFSVVIGVEVAFAIFFLLDIQGVAWTGIWFGLCSKNESMATFKTAFYVIVVPMLLTILSCVGWVLFVGWPIAAYYWARLQLQEHFRFLAGLRLASTGNLTSLLPFHVPNLPEDPSHD
jgi:ABC-type transport system involved in multi-copper enzyme maturation permease subunit